MLPDSLRDRFEVIRPLSSGSRSTVWQVRERASGVDRVVKLAPCQWMPAGDAIELADRRMRGSVGVMLPMESGVASDGRAYQILEYFPAGSLSVWLTANRETLTGTDRERCARNIVTDLAPVLEAFAAQDGDQRQLVHGDLKPSNLLLSDNGPDGVHYILADFDTLQIFDPSKVSTRGTPRYAAPEGLSETSDFWSLGMILLECVTGEHPLAQFSEHSARRLIQSIWKPELSEIDNDSVRALLAGLIERNPETRWRVNDLRRWLENEPEIIGEGLARCSETRAREPFLLYDTPCFSARELARQVLTTWSLEVLEQQALHDWLRVQLNRPDIAAYLAGLLTDVDLNDDLRLLEFCFALNSNGPPIWRRRVISRESIDRAALDVSRQNEGAEGAGAQGQESLEWLESLLDGACHRFFLGRIPRIGSMLGKLEHAIEGYSVAWDIAIQAGAPEHGRPDRADLVAEVVRAYCSVEMRRALKDFGERLAGLPFLLLLEDWTRCFGTDFRRLSVPQLLVFRRLNPLAVLETRGTVVGSYVGDDSRGGVARVAEPIIWPDTQRRLLGRLVPAPGAELVELQAGESFYDGELAPYAADVDREVRFGWHRLVQALRRFFRVTPRVAQTDDQRVREPHNRFAPEHGPRLVVRMIRVANPDIALLEHDSVVNHCYMALIQWDATGCQNPRLRILRAGSGLQQTRLLTPRLPERGRYAMLLMGNCDIRLQNGRFAILSHRRLPLWFSDLTRRLVVWSPTREPIVTRAKLKIAEPTRLLLHHDQIRLADSGSRHVGLLAKTAKNICPVDTSRFNSAGGDFRRRLALSISYAERLITTRARTNVQFAGEMTQRQGIQP